jgi:hypothetical protein
VILSGLAGLREQRDVLAGMLDRHRNLHLDTGGPDVRDVLAWFDALRSDPQGWMRFLRRYRKRILAGTATWTARKRYHWLTQVKLLTALRGVLEEQEFRMPLLPDGGWDEWRHDFGKEQRAAGLGLEPELVDDVLRGNFERILL